MTKVWLGILFTLISIDVLSWFSFQHQGAKKLSAPASYCLENRSLEYKFRHMAAKARSVRRHPIRSGWVDDLYSKKTPGHSQRPLVTFYGMSFSDHVGQQLEQLDDRVSVRLISGPNAPLSHSFYAYANDPHAAQVTYPVIGILLDKLPRLLSMNDGNFTFRRPLAYVFPRYYVEGRDLKVVEPFLRSYADFERGLEEPSIWNRHRTQMVEHDIFFSTHSFDGSWVDNSFVLSLIRASWVNTRNARAKDRILEDKSKFMNIAFTLLKQFKDIANERGQIPIVLVLNARSQGELEVELVEFLQQQQFAYVASSDLFSPDNPRNFLGDGHFTRECNIRIAEEVSQIIRDSSPE